MSPSIIFAWGLIFAAALAPKFAKDQDMKIFFITVFLCAAIGIFLGKFLDALV
jgi:hypothetical protein